MNYYSIALIRILFQPFAEQNIKDKIEFHYSPLWSPWGRCSSARCVEKGRRCVNKIVPAIFVGTRGSA